MSVFIEKITIKNLLSFDEEGITDFELKPLNVLIGANASGKSNFVAGIRILTACSGDFQREILNCGGAKEIMNKSTAFSDARIVADFHLFESMPHVEFATFFAIENQNAIVFIGETLDAPPWRSISGNRLELTQIELSIAYPKFFSWNESQDFESALNSSEKVAYIHHGMVENLPNIFYDRHRSILSNPIMPLMSLTQSSLQLIYERGFYPVFGPIQLQTANEAGVQQDFLYRDASNLASYLAVLEEKMLVEKYILPRVTEIYPKITGIGTTIRGGRVFITIKEKGNKQVTLQPRMSDGLLRFIAILAVLYQENPPPLICLEEPENGLHPDVVRVLASALKEASQRTQIIVTTHSPDLLGYMEPEDVVICERGEKGGTQMRRLSSETLKDWLKDYDLGQLWLSGELGGTRY